MTKHTKASWWALLNADHFDEICSATIIHTRISEIRIIHESFRLVMVDEWGNAAEPVLYGSLDAFETWSAYAMLENPEIAETVVGKFPPNPWSSQIQAGAISASQIAVNAITSSPIQAVSLSAPSSATGLSLTLHPTSQSGSGTLYI